LNRNVAFDARPVKSGTHDLTVPSVSIGSRSTFIKNRPGKRQRAIKRTNGDPMSSASPRTVSATQTGDATVSRSRVIFASFIGTAIEFYDFYVYATAAALVIGPVFFPHGSPAAQALSARAQSVLLSSAISATASAANPPWLRRCS
jgi:hypothetical protein